MRACLFLVCTVPLAMAQQTPPPAAARSQETMSSRPTSTLVPPVRPFHLPPRTGIETQMEVSLDQTLALALANNKDIEASRIDRLESDYTLSAAQGAFDPQLNVTSYWEQQVTPIASSLGGSATGSLLNKTWLADPGITQTLPWYGGTFKTDLSSADVSSNNTFLSLNPQYETSLNFSYTQPLWRNLLYDSNRHQIDVAKKNRSLTDAQFRQRVMAVVLQAEQAYWELSYAYNNLQVQMDAVRIGIQQDESNRRQQEQGLLAPIDVVAAQTQLANFEVGVYAAQSALTGAENALKELVLPDRSDATWSSAMIPVTPADVKAPITPLSDAIAEAMANRPEIAEVKITGEINQKDIRYYRDQTKPQVNLTALYTRAGLAGAVLPPGPNPFTAGFGPLTNQLNELSALAGLPQLPVISFGSSVIPPVLVGNYGHSLAGVWNGDFPTTEVQLNISLPIRNRTADANLGKSLAETRRIKNQMQQTEQNVQSDVRTAMENVQMAQLRLQSAQVARESAEEQYQSEQRQFRAGTSTLFLVQQRQATMITARSQERRSQADLSEAIAQFQLATGTILAERNIKLQ
ncbi:MAG TPA: TolC family protein [Bryobacteraceae bacterium]|jgi:outer membrane protein TolC|nr:TolC family protein [Bryobacteraceae bacterium]